MSKQKVMYRMLLLVIVTIAFVTLFYFFFKNSRAGSPLSDKEYMEQLANASKRYNVAGDPLISPTPEPLQENNSGVFSFILGPISEFIKSWSY